MRVFGAWRITGVPVAGWAALALRFFSPGNELGGWKERRIHEYSMFLEPNYGGSGLDPPRTQNNFIATHRKYPHEGDATGFREILVAVGGRLCNRLGLRGGLC